MRVLLVNSLFYPDEPGGAERVVRVLATALTRRGIETLVVALSRSGRVEHDVVGDVQVTRVPLANIYNPFADGRSHPGWKRLVWHGLDDWNPVMRRRLGKIIKAFRPDIVDLHNLAGFSSSAIAAAKACGVPVVQTVHDYYFACPKATMFRAETNCRAQCLECRVLTRQRRRASRTVDAVAGVSRAVLRTLEQTGVFRGVSVRKAIGNPCEQPADDAGRGPPGEGIRLGFLGRLDVTKGVETIIEAMRLMPDLPVTLVVAGRGDVSYETALKQRAAGLPVRFAGHVKPDVLLNQIDVLVVPSKWREPFGLVIFEAFARGIPVIGARIGGIPDCVGDGGTGWLVQPDNSAVLAARVRDLVETGFDRDAMAAACRRRAAEFSVDAIVDEKLRLFQETISGHAGWSAN